MSIKNYFIYFVLLLGLEGCAQTVNMAPGADPDGDGDAKGAVHFPLIRPATGNRVFIYDPQVHAWAAYDENGYRKNVGRATGGKSFCPDSGQPCQTAEGEFSILRKGDSDCVSNLYPLDTNGGAPMPYCMFFTPDGSAIHGTPYVPDYYNSHGCIGVTVPAASWLHGFLDVGSTVITLPY
jgi:lipoprotein-anchoring transpeptidase ErfK/SrfK